MKTIIHYTYKSVHTNGKYYVGRHSTKNLNDGYMGSGKWPISVKDRHNLCKEVLTLCDSFETLLEEEQKLLNTHIGKPNCMNFNNHSTGFATGLLNPANFPSEKVRKSKCRGPLAPMFGKTHSDSTKLKMSEDRKSKPTWNKGLSGIKTSDKGQSAWNKGIHTGHQSFTGKSHTSDSINKMKEKHAKRERLICPYCSKSIDKPNYTRYHGDKCKFKPDNLPFQRIST